MAANLTDQVRQAGLGAVQWVEALKIWSCLIEFDRTIDLCRVNSVGRRSVRRRLYCDVGSQLDRVI